MTLDEANRHFSEMLQKLRNMEPSPWPFLCAAAMLDYLAKMAIGSGRSSYINFIRSYMPPVYSTFRFADDRTDLPEQIYHVLRCGIVHSFSLTPEVRYYPSGRNETIVLAHQGSHLAGYSGLDGHHVDAVSFVFEDFANDIEGALARVFSDAAVDITLKARIEAHLRTNPPVAALRQLPVAPLAGTSLVMAGTSATSTTTTFTPPASGSYHP